MKAGSEKMMIVRGAQETSADNTELKKAPQQKLAIKEFSLCDYYLVRGTGISFKVYPFVKKHGKSTQAVGNCVYEYNEKVQKIIFDTDTEKNYAIVNANIKLQSLFSFVAMLSDISYDDILDIKKLCPVNNLSNMTLYEMLEAISKYKK